MTNWAALYNSGSSSKPSAAEYKSSAALFTFGVFCHWNNREWNSSFRGAGAFVEDENVSSSFGVLSTIRQRGTTRRLIFPGCSCIRFYHLSLKRGRYHVKRRNK